jgi:hypothetical protein
MVTSIERGLDPLTARDMAQVIERQLQDIVIGLRVSAEFSGTLLFGSTVVHRLLR